MRPEAPSRLTALEGKQSSTFLFMSHPWMIIQEKGRKIQRRNGCLPSSVKCPFCLGGRREDRDRGHTDIPWGHVPMSLLLPMRQPGHSWTLGQWCVRRRPRWAFL